MEQTAALFEELSLHAHPCLEEEAYDGWLLRFANGYTKRANSVNVFETSALPMEEKIKYREGGGKRIFGGGRCQ